MLINEINVNNLDIIGRVQKENIEDKLLLDFIINSLKEPYKTAFILRFMDGLDYKEIASVMNTSNQQIKNYLHRVKKSILKSWIKYDS